MAQDRPAPEVAVVLSGGGARAAYQVGLLRFLARLAPGYRFPIVTGVSAGGINAIFLAAHPGGVAEATTDLESLWHALEAGKVFNVHSLSLGGSALRWATRLAGGGRIAPEVRGLLDTRPLSRFLSRCLGTVDGEIPGVARNLDRGHLRAAALTTLNYSTGQTVTWVQGKNVRAWERSNRSCRQARLTIAHVMASAALPLVFPAIRLADGWHGDGGVRLAAPLAPAVNLGAERILAVSTRHQRASEETEVPAHRYPPPAQIIGKLLNAVFLDVLDQDAERLQRINALLREIPPERRDGMREVQCLVIRPSQDLGRLASRYEPRLPRTFRFLTRGLGTRETASPDFLSLLLFQPDYLRRLMEIGEADAEARAEEISRLLLE
jgi:NTE family protein